MMKSKELEARFFTLEQTQAELLKRLGSKEAVMKSVPNTLKSHEDKLAAQIAKEAEDKRKRDKASRRKRKRSLNEGGGTSSGQSSSSSTEESDNSDDDFSEEESEADSLNQKRQCLLKPAAASRISTGISRSTNSKSAAALPSSLNIATKNNEASQIIRFRINQFFRRRE